MITGKYDRQIDQLNWLRYVHDLALGCDPTLM